LEVYLENIIAYTVIFLLFAIIFLVYFFKHARRNKNVQVKIDKAIEYGSYEPVSLHPVVDIETCIGSGACIAACPEKDILGIINGKAHTINASRCVGHGACFHACPVQAITLCIGTEKRGVDLPHMSSEFETNIQGLFVAGELGGMGLIKNAVEQGRQAVEYITKKLKKNSKAEFDVVIVGAGPAGISGSLTAKKNNLKFLILEQDSLGGTVFNFPRAKLVMTSAMDIPLHGKVKLTETSKLKLLTLWKEILDKNKISINDQEKVEDIKKQNDTFEITTNKQKYTSRSVLLAIGRRGSPRKLGAIGEEKENVYYRLLEPELIHKQKILVVGGGDSAIESALLLADEDNDVTISYRSENFARLKPKNLDKINYADKSGRIKIIYNSSVLEFKDKSVLISIIDSDKKIEIENDMVYIFAGGELPTKFLEKIGITITTKYGDAILKH